MISSIDWPFDYSIYCVCLCVCLFVFKVGHRKTTLEHPVDPQVNVVDDKAGVTSTILDDETSLIQVVKLFNQTVDEDDDNDTPRASTST